MYNYRKRNLGYVGYCDQPTVGGIMRRTYGQRGSDPWYKPAVATSVSRGDSKRWKVTIWRLHDAPGEVRFTKLEVQNCATSVG